jgi:ribosomal protein S2
MKTYIDKITHKTLIKSFISTGGKIKELEKSKVNLVYHTPNDQIQIDTNKLLKEFKKTLSVVTNLSMKRGTLTIVLNQFNATPATPHNTYLLRSWPNGFISNFKRVGIKQNSRGQLPSLVIAITPNTSEIKKIEKECNKNLIPSIIVTSTNNKSGGLFSLTANNRNSNATTKILSLVEHAINFGTTKEVLTLSSSLFPRLDSNQ